MRHLYFLWCVGFGLPDDSGLQSTGVVEHSATALPVTSAGAYRITTDVYVEKFKRCPLLSTTARRRSSSAVCIHLAVEICQPVDRRRTFRIKMRIFDDARWYDKRGLCCRLVSIRPSVRPSVTFVCFVETRKRILKLFSPSGIDAPF